MTCSRLAKLGVAAAMFLAILIGTGGCGDGIAYTRRERQERERRILENDMKQLTDDWDSFWLNDAPTRLSPWRIR